MKVPSRIMIATTRSIYTCVLLGHLLLFPVSGFAEMRGGLSLGWLSPSGSVTPRDNELEDYLNSAIPLKATLAYRFQYFEIGGYLQYAFLRTECESTPSVILLQNCGGYHFSGGPQVKYEYRGFARWSPWATLGLGYSQLEVREEYRWLIPGEFRDGPMKDFQQVKTQFVGFEIPFLLGVSYAISKQWSVDLFAQLAPGKFVNSYYCEGSCSQSVAEYQSDEWYQWRGAGLDTTYSFPVGDSK